MMALLSHWLLYHLHFCIDDEHIVVLLTSVSTPLLYRWWCHCCHVDCSIDDDGNVFLLTSVSPPRANQCPLSKLNCNALGWLTRNLLLDLHLRGLFKVWIRLDGAFFALDDLFLDQLGLSMTWLLLTILALVSGSWGVRTLSHSVVYASCFGCSRSLHCVFGLKNAVLKINFNWRPHNFF